MSRQQISQREARRLRKRVSELEQAEAARTARYRRDYPGGTHLVTIDLSTLGETRGRLQGAGMVGAALVGKIDGSTLNVFGVLEPQ